MSETIKIDPDDFTLGEVAELEAIIGKPLGDIFTGGAVSAQSAIGLVYIAKRRQDPTFTLEDAKAVRVVDLEVARPDPTDAASSPSGRPSATSGG